MTGHSINQILIIKPSSLGDIIHTLPALERLGVLFPDAKIDWLVNTPYVSLLEGHPGIRKIIPFDRKSFGQFKGLDRLWQLAKELRKQKYDLVLDYQGLLRSGLLTGVTGAPYRIGFSHSREGSPMFYTHKVTLPSDCTHVLSQYIYLADQAWAQCHDHKNPDTPWSFSPISLEITPAQQNHIRSLLEQSGWTKQPIAVIHTGARWSSKRWFPVRIAETIKYLQDRHGFFVVFIGTEADIPTNLETQKYLEQPIADLSGKLNLSETAGLLKQAALVFGHDTGPLHLAWILGRPTLILFGPTSPDYLKPLGPQSTHLHLNVDCAPCRNTSCPKKDQICMTGISSSIVQEHLEQLIANTKHLY